ncbi:MULTISPECIES: hypothetical protein [Spirosoma]|uniref:Lipoprotein n=1 Tax=Spirosoma liriopis TaxID=2937440 RepID=A0ABT0HM14_9BACT|nr:MULTISPECIES: hypothetical protein [Spirosoma]MCK8493214.1 hypothetical protein [Spirosoma liriopis]UHG92609.1 hypothetical protein LQ777_06805 [Spirosoma oryzicola]
MRIVWLFVFGLSYLLSACSQWNLEPKTVKTTDSGTSAVFSKGQVLIPGLKGYDLDGGETLADGSSPADFYWNVEQVGRTSHAELYPHNGAQYAITTLDQSVLSNPSATLYATIRRLTYSDNSIATDSSTPIKTGSVLAFRTNEGRYGVFRVDKLGTDLSITLTWVTFNK